MAAPGPRPSVSELLARALKDNNITLSNAQNCTISIQGPEGVTQRFLINPSPNHRVNQQPAPQQHTPHQNSPQQHAPQRLANAPNQPTGDVLAWQKQFTGQLASGMLNSAVRLKAPDRSDAELHAAGALLALDGPVHHGPGVNRGSVGTGTQQDASAALHSQKTIDKAIEMMTEGLRAAEAAEALIAMHHSEDTESERED